MTQAQVGGLAAMNERMQQWMNEKPQGGNFNNTTELRLNQNDMVIFQFAASGNDGDRLIKAYRSHVFGQISKKGNRYNEHRYCAIQNGEGQECMFCQMGHTDIKERMSMWLLVQVILHASMPQVQQGQQPPNWPIVQYEGQNYYKEDVNAWKIWHTSAWRESPWSDICKQQAMYGSLHNFTAQIQCTGQGMQKRFKFYVLPNSATLPQEYYQQAWNSLQALPEMLRSEMTRQVAQNPQPGQAQWSQQQPIANPTNFFPGPVQQPQAAPIPFTPIAAPPLAVPTMGMPSMAPPPPPLATAPPQQPATFQPGSGQAAPAVPGADVAPSHVPTMAEVPVSHPNEAPPAPVQAVAAPVAPPALPTVPALPVAPPPAGPSIPPPPPAMPMVPSNPAGLQPQPVEQAPDDGRRPMRRMF